MDLFATQYTTEIDVRWAPALYGTVQNAMHKPSRRTLLKVAAVLMLAAGVRLLRPDLAWSTLCIATLSSAVALFLSLFTAITMLARARARRRYGCLPAPVRVRFSRDGIDVAYAALAPRRVPFSFVNNWWHAAKSGCWTIVLGQHLIERCAFSVDPKLLDEADRNWLLTVLEHARKRGQRKSDQSQTGD